MLDIKRIREEKDQVLAGLAKRHGEYPVDEALKLDDERRGLLAEVEQKKAERNRVSKEIPQLKKEGKDVC